MNTKNFIFATALFFSTFAAAATTSETAPQAAPTEKAWTNTIGLGLAMPVSRHNVNGNEPRYIGVGMEFTYFGMAKNGFSLEMNYAGGIASTDDIKFEGSKHNAESDRYTSFDFGLGYTFGAGKKYSLSVLVTVGYEVAYFESESKEYQHEELGKVDRHFEESLGGITLGGDIIGRKSITDHTSIYASVGTRWIAKSISMSTVTYEKGDDTRTDTHTNDDNSGKYSVVPSIGVMYSF